MRRTKSRKPPVRKARPKLAPRSERSKSGLIYKAIPSSGTIRVTLSDRATLQPKVPGRTIFDDEVKADFVPQAREYWHPDTAGQQALKGKWIVNALADPDHYPHALEFLARKLDGHDMPVFNHPQAVIETRRDLSARKLAGIKNLIVPKCERFLATHPDHFLQTFERGGFAYPVLVRPAGSHTGEDLVKVDGPQDWHKVHHIPWGGQYIFMTQWVDFQNAAGHWPKIRLSVTSAGIQLRHILYGDGWLIHSVVRDEETLKRELEILNNAHEWEAIHELGREIRDRVGLDFFGVDLGWKSDSEFVLFEANASMSILSRRNMPELHEKNYLRVQQDVRRALARVTGAVLPDGIAE